MRFKIKAMKKLATELGAKCNIISVDGVTNYRWLSNDITQPTAEEIETKANELLEEYQANEYQRLRKYPSIGQQLGMLFDTIKEGGAIDTECVWFKTIQAEKDRVPKD